MPIDKTILVLTLCRILFQLGLLFGSLQFQCLQFPAVLSDLELIQGIRIQHHSHTHHIRHSRVHRSRRIRLHHSRPQSQQTSCHSILHNQNSQVHRSRRIRLHHSRPQSQQ